MTRAQYIALCLIGGVAVAAWLQSYKLAKYVNQITAGGYKSPSGIAI